MKPSPELSVVLPCYNEALGIEAILRRFQEVGAGYDFELILLDNGSTDRTPEKLAELLLHYPFARAVRVEVNQGYGHGIYTGLRSARGRVLSWSHADLQTDPGDVFGAVEALQSKPEPRRVIIKGCRHGRRLTERIVSRGMQVLATVLLRTRMHEINAQPKVFDRALLDCLHDPPVDFNFDLYVLYQAASNGWRIESIPVQFPPRPYGQSNWAATWHSKARTIGRAVRFMCRLGWSGNRGDRAMAEADARAWPQSNASNKTRFAA